MKKLIRFLKRILGIGDKSSDYSITVDRSQELPNVVTSEFKFIIGKIKCDKGEVALCDTAIKELNRIFNLKEFKDDVLNFKYSDGSNGIDVLNNFRKQVNVVNISFFYGSFMQNKVYKTVGLDNGTGVVFVNRYFVDDVKTLTSLCAHEISHALGYSHQSAKDYYSVPYTLNRLVEKYFN